MAGLAVPERKNKMKKILLFCIIPLMIFCGCQNVLFTPQDMLTTAVTIHDYRTFKANGSGSIIDVSRLTEDLNMVTVLTAFHVAKDNPTPLICIRRYDKNGMVVRTIIAQGVIYTGYPARDLATIWFTVSRKIKLKVAPVAKNHNFVVGEKLWLTSSPAGAYPLLNEGIFGGWCRASLFVVHPGGYYTGGVSPGSSGGGIFNDKYELVGVISRVLSTPFIIGTEKSKTIPILINKKTGEKVKIAPYDHRHILPLIHPQGGIFIPFTRKKIDGLFLERFKTAKEQQKDEKNASEN